MQIKFKEEQGTFVGPFFFFEISNAKKNFHKLKQGMKMKFH
jgi:hypothetical protein